jgi:hypothetical protein
VDVDVKTVNFSPFAMGRYKPVEKISTEQTKLTHFYLIKFRINKSYLKPEIQILN